jgi:hypothetical protein
MLVQSRFGRQNARRSDRADICKARLRKIHAVGNMARLANIQI